MDDIFEIIKTRRSIRAFKPDEVDEALLDKVLEAGTFAPTGRGLQSPVIVAVKDQKTRDYFSSLNAKVLGSDADPYYGAPIILVVLAEGERNTFIEDGSCVLENMMLAAHALGLGSCWIHREREIFDSAEGKALLKKWGLSDSLRGVGSLALGYPDQTPTAKERKKDYIVKI